MDQVHAEYLAKNLQAAMLEVAIQKLITAIEGKVGKGRKFPVEQQSIALCKALKINAVQLEGKAPQRARDAEHEFGLQFRYVVKPRDVEEMELEVLDIVYDAADKVRKKYMEENGADSWPDASLVRNEVIFAPLVVDVNVSGRGQVTIGK